MKPEMRQELANRARVEQISVGAVIRRALVQYLYR
jgi:hypothetical protein